MSGSEWGRELSGRGGGNVRGRLTPARLRLLRLRRIIRLRRKLRRARQAPSRAREHAPRVSLPVLFVLFALGAAMAAGCGWFGTEHSVRFNYWHGERQFSRLPPLPFDARARTKPDYRSEDEGEESETPDDTDEKATELWARVSEAERQGDYAQLRKHLGAFLKVADAEECGSLVDASVNCRQRLSSARDQLDALDSLERGASAQAVGAYLAARRAYDRWLPTTDGDTAEEAKHKMTPEEAADPYVPVAAALEAVPRDALVEDNVAYLRAALYSESGDRGRGADAFERLATRYPRSEKREAALLSAGLSWMKGSDVGFGSVEHAAAEDACPECKDEPWRKAVAAFERLLRDYPRGRYADDARGWLAFLRVRVGERAEGLAEYYRMLAVDDTAAREEALRSLRLVRADATEEEMARVESLLEDEPRVALAYAYHEIYNAALGFGFSVRVPEDANPYNWCVENEASEKCYANHSQWEEKERERRTRNVERTALARVAGFATRQLRRQTGGASGGAFALRVAQANLELDEDRAARELATRALSAGLEGNERASALWVRGVAEYRLKEFAASRRTFNALIAEFPAGDLAEGARRYIAMVAEDEGDLDGALEQYLALDYTEDAAYFMDVLMTPEQLAAFAERHQDSPARDVLFYSLGVRYLRVHHFEAARAAYARVRTVSGAGFDYNYDGGDVCRESYPPPHCADSKNSRGQEWKGVRAEWVLRDLKTMEEMEHLEARFWVANNEEARAESLYQLAGYIYESSELVFYNPAAWRGGRFYAFYYDQQFRAPGEAAVMRRHMEEHEPLVRALSIYLRVVEEYPRTRAARDSLYTAAVIHERLAGFELYWPGQYREGLYPGARLVTYEDVRRAYPDYPLPAGTYGWEPSTRTVNGREAWPAPPKPRRLTGMERARLRIGRVERKVEQAWELFGEIYGGRVRAWTVAAVRLLVAAARWAFVAFTAGVVLIIFRRTRRARRFIYRWLRRGQRSSRAREIYAPRFSYAAPGVTGAGLRDAAAQTARNLQRIALHERGRAALSLNLFTHGLLTVLVWAVLWAAR